MSFSGVIMSYFLDQTHRRHDVKRTCLALIVLGFSLSFGCADNTAPLPMGGTQVAGTEMGGQQFGGTNIPPAGTQFMLSSATNQTLVDVGGMLDLRLRYIQNNVTPVGGKRITFEMLNQAQMPAPGGVDGSTLSAASTTTPVS